MVYVLRQIGINLVLILSLFSCISPQQETKQENEIKVISSTNHMAHSVYLTKNQAGIPVIGWTEQDTTENKQKYFYFSVLDSASNDFKNKLLIPIAQHAALHTEGMPKIAFKETGEIVAVFEVKLESEFNPYAGEIHYIVSKDGGKHWAAPQVVHSSRAAHKGRAFFDMITLADGEIGISWLGESYADGGRPVMFAKTNTANTFVNELMVDSMACECCRTAIYADKDGTTSIVYRDIINNSIRDISVSVSHDHGNSFSDPVCFSGDHWNINGCPHNGPDVVSDKYNIYATWFTGGDESGVYYAKLNKQTLDTEKQLISKDARNIQLTPDSGSSVVVYNESYSNQGEFYARIVAMNTESEQKTLINDKNKRSHSPVIIEWEGKNIISWIENYGNVDVIAYSLMEWNN